MSPPQVTINFPEHLNLKPVTIQTGLFLNNEFVESVDKKTFETINPSNGKVLGSISEASSKDVDKAVDFAREAFETSWGTKASASLRSELMMKLAYAIEDNIEILAAIESIDNGKAYKTALAVDLPQTIRWFKYYAGWAGKNSGEVFEVDEKKFLFTTHEPLGVVGQIVPCLMMLSWKLCPALATGNTIVFKPAEQTSLSTLYLASLIAKIFPKGVVNILPGFGPGVGNAIVEHPSIEKIAFTGSTAVGKIIMAKAAQSNLKRVTLELGGKSPNIIFDDADIQQAVKWAAFGLFFNHGQCCCAGSRVYVQETIFDKFFEEFVKHVKTLKVGDPFDSGTFQGPQISQLQYDRIMAYIKSGKEEGAKCVLGGNRFGNEGYFIEPTIFTDTKPEMKIMQEEIFGPVVAINKFKDEEEVIKLSNSSIYGLAAAIHTKDLNRSLRISRELKAGTVWINCYNILDAEAPFGGFKQSGIGSENGRYALDNYTSVKAVHVNISQKI
ncbi:aldehyde dehydrogenase [Phakopsora pachyrhizi]|uniref:Aldehyde dehydrogenase n=1 Tax=Phakopsora pachyrhizi TaxID=170000 RepID=A0AAV0AGM9_PHAPC|nr:aldehyde dehydrogenase [Phakopsora pachyrhizi]CAH7665803.1 aldehyde dehydrogenase [Phakopsora pachyrhizi]